MHFYLFLNFFMFTSLCSLLHLTIGREYLEKEFRDGDFRAAGGFDIERIIDDFVFLVRGRARASSMFRTFICECSQ